MRYLRIDDIIFTNKNGITRTIKDLRPLESYDVTVSVDIKAQDKMDEVITRREFYGDEAEYITYVMVDGNKVQMVENHFDVTKMKKLLVPIINSI